MVKIKGELGVETRALYVFNQKPGHYTNAQLMY
jgi:hypothetical protein